MNAIDYVTPRLKTEEAFRSKAYKDTHGLTTIGYGFCVDAGISQYAAAALLTAQIQERDQALLVYSWYQGLDPIRQSVILDVSFNVGVEGLLHFPNMIMALTRKDWLGAEQELLNSEVAHELVERYDALANILLTGVDPNANN